MLFSVLFFSLCISCFTIYHGIRDTIVSLFTQAREQHDPHSAELTWILRARDTNFSQGLESCPYYSQKIIVGSLQRNQSVQHSKDRGRRECKRRNFKYSCNFQESSKIDEEEMQDRRTFKELEEFVQFVKDSCRRHKR
jgi:hypothetical protein